MKKAIFFSIAAGTALLCGCAICSTGSAGAPGAAPAAKTAQQPPRKTRPSVHPDSRGWKPLFQHDLSDARFTPGVWTVNDKGVLTPSKDEAIWTAREYGDFVLDLEYRCDPAANSGVLFHCTDTANWIPNAVEIQILDDNDPHWAKDRPQNKNGGLYGHLAPKVNNVKPAGEWNRMTVTAKGRHIIVAVNGEITVDADLSRWTSAKKNPDGSDIPPWLTRPWAELPTRGRIGLQGKHGSAATCFRSIKIKEL